ncbi:Bug family tripartite tricarboxylate transporter substrate binding protein [Paracandidimonas soli]|uniref:Tripartite-type tricarboxylate transporter receptor subunit TctC n=1 Tax=Paracandidimonas soli TaxID=1917182 RepID=A0A4R3UJW4_9BURK|nr:tripartite tricarboxylate transporter substrate binding protein [Paracandidimonas soli]TCU91936.1 tripartite-type tricarboxylate transporter receptor subunit TctC [Paracandidimonas soli]
MKTSRLQLIRRRLLAALASASCLAFPFAAQADASYPDKPVRIVVPYPPGGANDVIGRLVAQRLSLMTGQQFVVENKPGATGLTGTAHVAGTAPDGYTLLVSASVHVIYPSLFKEVTFDPLKDFTPISQLASGSLILSVNPSQPFKTLQELLAYAKANPGKLQYASSGNGSATHLAAEALKQQAGVDIGHIPYRGGAPALSDTIAGHVPMIIDPVASSMPFLTSGKLRALAVTTAQRSPLLPDLPTVAESGLPNYDIGTWYGLWAPAGTPDAVVAKLSSLVAEAIRHPETQERLQALGLQGVGNSPAEFKAYNASEYEKWKAVVAESGATMD